MCGKKPRHETSIHPPSKNGNRIGAIPLSLDRKETSCMYEIVSSGIRVKGLTPGSIIQLIILTPVKFKQYWKAKTENSTNCISLANKTVLKNYQSCITPMSPRSYITGKVLGPLTGTTLRTQQSTFLSANAAANLPP